MKNLRNRIETWFETYAHVIYRNWIITIIIMIILTVTMISQIPKITIDTSTEGFLHANDPALLAYNNFRDQFGRDEVIIIAIKSVDIFSQRFLEKIQKVHEELEENVPYIDDITSLVNVRNTRGEADELIVEDLLEHWPQNQNQRAGLKERVLTNPLYKNLLISEDATFTTIIIKTHSHSSLGQEVDVLEGFEEEAAEDSGTKLKAAVHGDYLTDKENSQAVNAAREVIEKYQASDFQIYMAGSPAVTDFLKRTMMADLRKFLVLAVIAVAILLYVMFRRISGALLPLVIVVLSLLSTLGIMALAGVAIKVPTQILPSFLLAVGVGTSVHILAIFYQRLQQTKDKEEAIAYALGHSGLAVGMTNVTTASGLMSFATSEIAPIADLGLFAGIGVLLTFIDTLVLLPAFLALVPVSAKRSNSRQFKSTLMDRFLSAISHFSTTYSMFFKLAFAPIFFSVLVIGLTGNSFLPHLFKILRTIAFPVKDDYKAMKITIRL